MKPRKAIPKVSAKKLKALGRMPSSTITAPRKPLPKANKRIEPKCVCGHPVAIHSRPVADSTRHGLCLKSRCHCRVYRPKSLKRSPIKKGTAKRRFPRGEDRKYLAWIRTQPCALIGRYYHINGAPIFVHKCPAESEAAHIKSKGAGGRDRGNVIPLDSHSHKMQHRVGIVSWAAQYGFKDVDELKQLALDYDARYEREARSQS